MAAQFPCEIRAEKIITVGQKSVLQCLLPDDLLKIQRFEFQVFDAAEFSLQFLGLPQVKEKILEQEFTSYKVGTYKFDKINLKADEKSFLVTPIEFEVKTVITEPSPTPYPIVGAQALPAPWWWWAFWACVLAALLGVIYREYKKWQRRKIEEAARPKAKILTAFEKYKLQLQKLESQDLHRKGEYKKFALELSQIVKKSIGEKLNFAADDLTTEELFETLEKKHKKFFTPVQGLLTNMFITLDQIKFAKTPATAEMCMAMIDAARQIGDELFKDEALGGTP